MARSVTFLQLASEFGGTKFGPFDQVEIRLGSDPTNSDITLPETLGVASQHVKLLKQQDDSFILAPVDKSAAIFHFRSGTARPKQVLAPTAIQGGDAFSLVTPEGPRFYIQLEKDSKVIAQQAQDSAGPSFGWPKGIRKPSAQRLGRGIMMEIRRRGFAAVFTTRLGNMFMRAWLMVRSGQIFSPLYIVSGMLMLSGWIFAGGAACTAWRASSSRNDFTNQLSNCKDQLGVAQGADGELGDPTVPDLTKIVLEDATWKETVLGDKDLYESYARALRDIYAEPLKYRWVYTQKGSPYTQFKAALDASGMPPNLVRTLAFAAASPTFERPWALVKDSESAEVCGRGPLAITYRQAFNLGLAIQPDALVERQLAESNDLVRQRERLDNTLRDANTEYEYRDDLIQYVGAEVQGGLMCMYVDGTDERTDLRVLASTLKARVGASATQKLPREGEQHWIASRLVMLFAHDFKAHELEGISFDARMAPSVAMSTKDVKGERVKFAVREAAKVMARAAAIPCLAQFDKEQREVPGWFMEQPPKLGSCAILKAYVEYDRL